MAFEDVLQATKESVQNSLDELTSPRTSPRCKTLALKNLERNLAIACCGTKADSEQRDSFLALQYTYECNIPSRLLSWIALSTLRLEAITNKGSMDDEHTSEAAELTAQLLLGLSLVQGVVLNHVSSKQFLGRKCALETLLDLLLASRHLPTPADNPNPAPKSNALSENLTSVVLDTLLCILVDACPALRAFEEANGVQAVVKILKRAGTPREVRMKCLEFLYFYLLDETPSASALAVVQLTPPPTAPATPVRQGKPFLNATPLRPSSRYGSSTFSFSTSTTSSLSESTSSRSTSGSSGYSFNSTSSNASSSTAASSTSASPQKVTATLPPNKLRSKSPAKRVITPQNQRQSPPTSPPLPSTARFTQLRSMMMLKKEVDYVPQSPKKVAGLGARRPQHSKSMSMSNISPTNARTRSIVPSTLKIEEEGKSLAIDMHTISGLEEQQKMGSDGRWRTTEEKKELLGTMLGNVDALVEGVRKAGIWGLG